MDDAFAELAADLEREIRVQNISSRSGETYLLHFDVEGGDPDRVLEVAGRTTAIEAVRPVSESDPALFEAVIVGECIPTDIAGLGANIRSVTVETYQLRLSIPEDRNRQTFVRRLERQYPDVESRIQRDGSSSRATPWRGLLGESLTDRQRDVMNAAYYSGFFDRRRKSTGTEIVDSLGISQPAFSKQLRAAQYKLLSSIYDERCRPAATNRETRTEEL